MNILPRVLYVFHALPIAITDKQLNEWDKLISRYIWQEKKTRLRFQTLQLTENKGRL